VIDWDEERDDEMRADAAWDDYLHGIAREAAAERVRAVCAAAAISPLLPAEESRAVDEILEDGDYEFG
jgi:hypothetical protein